MGVDRFFAVIGRKLREILFSGNLSCDRGNLNENVETEKSVGERCHGSNGK